MNLKNQKILKLFSISELNSSAQNFVLKSFFSYISFYFILMLTNTFYILHALTIVTITELGLIFALKLFLTALTDYPSGALGDYIGQRWVLVISCILYFFAYFSFFISTDFMGILISFVIIGLAQGQESGSFNSWFDNNYKAYVKEDKDRTLYGSILAKLTMYLRLLTAISFILGGIFIMVFGIKMLFLLQSVSLLFFSSIFILFLKNHISIENKIYLSSLINKSTNQRYIKVIRDGIKVSFSNKAISLFLIGTVIVETFVLLFVMMLMWPLFDMVGKTNELIGLIRSGIYISLAISFGLLGTISKRIINVKKWLLILNGSSYLLFFFTFGLFVYFYPTTNEIYIIGVIIFFILQVILHLPLNLNVIIKQRFMLDLIPDENRNSFFSFSNSLILILSVPIMGISGYFIESYGIFPVIIFVGIISTFGGIILSLSAYTINLNYDYKSQINHQENYLNRIDTNKIQLQYTSPKIKFSSVWESFEVSFNCLWDELIETAGKDKIITEDERKLILRIMNVVKGYANALEVVVSSDNTTKNNIEALHEIRNISLPLAMKDIERKGEFSSDEQELLFTYKKYIDQWNNSHNFSF